LYTQATTGSGGWPLNVFLTPNLKPFFGGTYFGVDEAPGRPSFRSLLTLICGRWIGEAAELEMSSTRVLEKLRKSTDFVAGGSDSHGDVTRIKSIQKAFLYFQESFDREWGGFGQGAKFPMPGTIAMLLRYWSLWKELSSAKNPPTLAELRQQFPGNQDESKLRASWDETVKGGLKMASEALAMVQFTLFNIVRGGIRDHVGGGFHRYCVDRSWALPHFEKMLCDQAQLIHLLSEATLVMEDGSEFRVAVEEAISYCQARLLDASTGLFYAAEDADSLNSTGDHEEGAHVTWTDEEVNKCFLEDAKWPAEDVKVFKYHYTILPRGNISPLKSSSIVNVLRERANPRVTADKLKRSLPEVIKILSEGKKVLFNYRMQTRTHPHRDEKIITAWNGMMIGALARASRTLQSPKYLQMAQKAATSLLRCATWTDERDLLCLYRVVGNDRIPGFAEDYACLIGGLIELYEADFSSEWLTLASRLFATLDELFRDKAAFGYYDTMASSKAPLGILRVKPDYDGVEPSPNSQQALNALHLNLLRPSKCYLERLRQIEKLFTRKRLDKEPQAMTTLVSAIILDASKPGTLVLNGKPGSALKEALDGQFRPNLMVKVVEVAEEGDAEKAESAEGVGKEASKGHLCRGNTCSASVEGTEAILDLL
jgi:uncharacterized protein YyaL (SSP411 family)